MNDRETKAHTHTRRIVLTGFMCAGKTTIAHALAARLNCAMLDTDDLITERAGRSIEAIFDEDGETRFRQIETKTLRAVLSGDARAVIALGGGTWTLPANRALVNKHRCLTVWLDAPFELCWQRIERSHHARPLARERERALRLYAARRADYALAALRVSVTETRSAEDTAAEIASIIGRQNFSDEHEESEGENSDG
ncbi:MAG TPA: shikimate kinase [Pyrinomonadaceae bacterium]|nr:shikimate kinase [Pyrinomonadaceae bacterium]